jgi:hypothetical protein
MNYWLICLPRPDLEHCIESHVFGLGRKNLIGSVRAGDKIVCCAGKGDWSVIATGEATSDYYFDDAKVFLKKGSFFDRFNFDADLVENELDIKSVLEEISFVTNLAFWAVYFRNGIAKMTKSDWDLIVTACSTQKLKSAK